MIISGIILFGGVLTGDVGGSDMTHETHITTPLSVRLRLVRFTSSAVVGTATYSPGVRLIQTYVGLVVSGGT